VLRANADAWIQVRDRAGPILLNRTLHPGETWEVPVRPNLLLTTGNAGGTDLLVDGVAAPSLGASGAVRRDLPLDPDLIKDGKLPVAGARTGSQ
jgi:cytoskeleton protein RodZ